MGAVPINDFLGIVGDDNPHSVAPPGSFETAKNVVFRRQNTGEPRSGFTYESSGGGPASISSEAAKILQWQGKLFPVSSEGELFRRDEDQIVSLNEFTEDALTAQLVPMRGFAFFNSDTGLKKLRGTVDESANDELTLANGLPIPYIRHGGFSAGTKLLDTESIAYRGVYGRKTISADGEEFWAYSVPGSRLVITNTTGSTTIDPTVQLELHPDMEAGDWFFLYASRPAAADPDDELAEIVRHEITAEEIIAEAIQLSDRLPNAQRGAALYTNPSRGGLARANFEAPLCRAMAEYRGSLFFGDLLEPRRIELRFKEGGDCSGDTTGIGYRVISGRRTNGSAVITNVASTTGIQLGMMLEGSSWNGTAAQQIIVTAVTANSVTVTQTWGGASDGGNVDIDIVDTILINSVYYPASQISAIISAFSIGASDYRLDAVSHMRAYAKGNAITWNSSTDQVLLERVYLVIEESRPGQATMAFAATHGNEYDPPLPLVSGSTTLDLEPDTIRNGIAWSKKDEPHHVPLGNRQPVGDGQSAVVALVSARDALWIFQDDGRVWRLYGFGEASGWRIDPFEYGYKLIGPNAIAKMDEVVYAATAKGVVALTDAGIVNISDGFVGRALASTFAPAFDEASEGISLAVNEKHKEIVLTINDGDSGENEYTPAIYCFNVRNKRWSTWELPHDPIAFTCVDGRYYYFTPGVGDGGEGGISSYLLAERTDEDSHRYSDQSYTFSTSSVGPTECDVSSISDDPFTGADYVPGVGDKIVDNSSAAINYIASLVDANTITFSGDGAQPIGACTVYRAFEVILKWQPLALGDPAARKFWHSIALTFEPLDHARFWTFVFDSEDDSPTSVVQSGTAADTGTRYMRCHVPRAHARKAKLRPQLTMQQADLHFRLVGMTLQAEILGPRVQR